MDKNKTSKMIRGITAPPIMVIFMMLFLHEKHPDYFKNQNDFLMSICCLGIIPLLVYIIPRVLKNYNGDRERERRLAFIWSVLGYSLAFLYGLMIPISPELMQIFKTYLFSVIVLSVCNGILKVRASGHACSGIVPILTLIGFREYGVAILFLIFTVLSFHASLQLKRHTARELGIGCILGCAAFIAAGI